MADTLTKEQQAYLLQLARKAISHHLKEGKTLAFDSDDQLLQERRGAFVTLKVEDQLRGCVGYPLPEEPLGKAVIEMAVAASAKDFRFPPLTEEELSRLKIEISVLSLPKPIQDIQEITVGEHGIIISSGRHKGLLLPQVPVEWGWDLETYLKHGCLKAGLDEEAWKEGAEIKIFTAQVFKEK